MALNLGDMDVESEGPFFSQVLFQALLLCKLSLARIKPQLMTDTLGRLGNA